MLQDKHAGEKAAEEFGPHSWSDDWQHCDECLSVPQTHAFANLIRAYWRAVDVLEGRL